MPPIDRRGRLGSDPFDHRVRSGGQVEIWRGGKVVIVIGGARAARLATRLDAADSEEQRQLLLARASGHYKH